ncbi:hypothetical protein [Jatrophihabitans endophyticus]|uniref:hypothetical protein n=1 Tax=Jatrophihabitans endophyticus TaxID=1206085 RepID=UPI0019F7CEEE|nr:hypothetical protein [Jatrophihabitans endophyticus]MBE7190119.1 hypothetical protein [Jatrophihabitans endophyticus]
MTLRKLATLAVAAAVSTMPFPIVRAVAATVPAPVTGTAQAQGVRFYNVGAQGCDAQDTPDAPARAFRDGSGTIHLFAAASVDRAMTGRSFNTLKHDCSVVFQGEKSGNPADFDDADWLTSFWVMDGRTVFAIIHDEFHGWEHPGQCPSGDPSRCIATSLLGAISNDGGQHFYSVPGNAALGATPPYRYDPNQSAGFSYGNPTNIMKRGAYYYVMFNSQDPFASGHDGVCIGRTANLLDPAAWRIWDGSGFNIRSSDPYTTAIADPDKVGCHPVVPATGPGYAGSLSFLPSRRVYVLAMYSFGQDGNGKRAGTYILTSADLLHWSQPQLLLADDAIPSNQGGHQYYPSLIDPNSPDPNFGTIGRHPILFTTSEATDAADWSLWGRQVSLR